MSFKFNRENQLEILLKYLPTGKAYTQAYAEGSNFNKLMEWLASFFDNFIIYINKLLTARFLCLSNFFVKESMADHLLPNDIFYLSDPQHNNIDLFVMQYLMKGNTEWHFQAIANIYDFDVLFGREHGEYDPDYNPPVDRKDYNVLYVTFYPPAQAGFEYDFDFPFGDAIGTKIKQIYEIIKEAQVKIIYLKPKFTILREDYWDYLPGDVPYLVGKKVIERTVYDEIENVEKIKFCDGLYLK